MASSSWQRGATEQCSPPRDSLLATSNARIDHIATDCTYPIEDSLLMQYGITSSKNYLLSTSVLLVMRSYTHYQFVPAASASRCFSALV